MSDTVRELKNVIEKSKKTLLKRLDESMNYLQDVELLKKKAELIE